MKTTLFILFCLIGFLSSGFAQTIKDPTKWSYEIHPKKNNVYEIITNVAIEDGWHLFDLNPGGDGFLIPTTILINEDKNIISSNTVVAKGKLITADFEGVDGKVNYYEHKITYVTTITCTKPLSKIGGVITYQACNDKICLPPVDMKFEASIQQSQNLLELE